MSIRSDALSYNYKDIFYCCYLENDMHVENMVSEHMLGYICSGELLLISKDKREHLKKGDSFFLKKNHMLRKVKQPGKDEPFKGLFLQLRMPFLKAMASENKITVPLINSPSVTKANYILLDKHPFLKGLFISLEQYIEAQQYPSKELIEVKLKEAVYALLQTKPELGSVLFDFAEPWKIDLSEFMIMNFRYDLSVEQFAHFTGRSLSTFKKDFHNIFDNTPSRWLMKKRLEEAKNLIENAGKKPSDIYLEVGFKNLSHFSTAFKKEFGFPPSALLNSIAI